MSEYKIGQLVKCNDNIVSTIGIIVEIRSQKSYPYLVQYITKGYSPRPFSKGEMVKIYYNNKYL